MAVQKKFYKGPQKKRLSKVIGLAGARYTPKLNVEVSIASVFDGIGRTPQFYDELKKPANEILNNLRQIKDEEINKVTAKEFNNVRTNAFNATNLILKIPKTGVRRINFRPIVSSSEKTNKAIQKCIRLLRDEEEKERKLKEQENREKKGASWKD